MTEIYEPLMPGNREKANLRHWRAHNMRVQAAQLDSDPDAGNFIIDLVADTSLEELSDEQVERIVAGCTVDNLGALGYSGARSRRGNITCFHTALLYAVKKEFGDDSVRLGFFKDPILANCKFRGIRNTTEIREFYAHEVQRLIRRLLNTNP